MKILGQYFPSFKTKQEEKIYFRKLTEADIIPLVEFYYHLSQETRYLRFQMITDGIPENKVYEYAEKLCKLENKGLAIVAYTYEDSIESFVGVARYMQNLETDTQAEFAIVLQDGFQGKGIGRYLLHLLFEEAKRYGLIKLYGTMLYSNTGIIELIKKVAPDNHHFTHAEGQMEVEIIL
ncbi:MAG: GNAT family N-acetyltransferase [Raineya sp.]|jgi:acetyltransferase|nr:GNAT family N-acetyltransferase [Raineya sp.]